MAIIALGELLSLHTEPAYALHAFINQSCVVWRRTLLARWLYERARNTCWLSTHLT